LGASERKWDAGSDGDMVDVVVVMVISVVSDVELLMSMSISWRMEDSMMLINKKSRSTRSQLGPVAPKTDEFASDTTHGGWGKGAISLSDADGTIHPGPMFGSRRRDLGGKKNDREGCTAESTAYTACRQIDDLT
jgi:hypothetical protein